MDGADMGGISVLVMLGAMGFFAFIFLAAVALFLAAVVLTIVFAARTKKRRAQGKKLGGLIALPIVFYAVSVPILVFMAVAVFIPATYAGLTTDYDDCSLAIVDHDPELLDQALDASDLQLGDEGAESYRNLLRTTITYGDAECAEVVLADAHDKGRPIDLNEPLVRYDTDGNASDSEYALIMATSISFSSLDMVELLLDNGADANVADAWGRTPLHNACTDLCTLGLGSDKSSATLDDTDAAIDLLLSAGADITAQDQDGLTPWDLYRQTLREYVDEGSLTQEEALDHLSERANVLEP